MQIQDKRVVVTGAASGIGKALSKIYLKPDKEFSGISPLAPL